MKFFADHDVYAVTVRFLRNMGHDTVTAYETGLSEAYDADLLRKAGELNRILVTRDRDFGGLVFAEKMANGVIYLRMLPSTQNAVHDELAKVIKTYSEDDLKKAFVVIEPGRHRFRRLNFLK